MKKAEEIIDNGCVSMEFWMDFLMEVMFELREGNESHFIKYLFHFNPTYRTRSCELIKSTNVEFPNKEQENVRLRVEKIIEEPRKKLERRANEILDELTFTKDYEIATIVHLGDKKQISLKNVTIGERKAEISWFLFGDNTFELDIEHEENIIKEEYYEVNFIFSRSFALQHLKGMKEFEEFLYKKSKDRLGLLFQEKNAQ